MLPWRAGVAAAHAYDCVTHRPLWRRYGLWGGQEPGVSKTLAIYQFGPFRLDPSRRQLTRDGVPVTLNSRAFEVLHLLARQQGGLVTRDEILAHVWRGVTVEENNLTVQISALRRALGDLPDHSPIIVTVPNQGYRLAGNVARLSPAIEVPEVV